MNIKMANLTEQVSFLQGLCIYLVEKNNSKVSIDLKEMGSLTGKLLMELDYTSNTLVVSFIKTEDIH